MMKRPILAVLIFLFVIAFVFLIRIKDFGSFEGSEETGVGTGQGNSASSETTNPQANGGTISQAQLAQHNSASDCWVVYKNKVYDITSFLGQHPGGVNSIARHCGTNGFEQAFIAQHGNSKANMFMSVTTFVGDADIVGGA